MIEAEVEVCEKEFYKIYNVRMSIVQVFTNNLQDVWENIMGRLLSILNSPDPLLDAVPANGSDGPHCLPVPLCHNRMQEL